MTLVGALKFLRKSNPYQVYRLSFKSERGWYDGDENTDLSGEALFLFDYIWDSV